MKKIALFLSASFVVLIGVAQNLQYEFTAPNAAHHEAVITVTATKLPAGPATFLMSRSSPGRYATHEFGKNVYKVSAVDGTGKALEIEKPDGGVYTIAKHNGTVKLQYTLYGNHADGTYASIDPTGFHLNMPASFMWVKGLEKAPITIRFSLPDPGWTIATQLFPTNDKTVFTAPHLQYFMDAPTKAGALRYREWPVSNKDGKPFTVRIAFDTEASETQLDSMTAKVKKIVAEAGAVFGEYPNFETGRYTFLASLHPWAEGDGMEHRNSTMISLPVQPAMIEAGLGTFSHEFFHCWNVERIRPKTLEPFNFEHSNISDGLWVAEGFTQYYGNLVELRSGLRQQSGWINNMAGFINTKTHRPGGEFYNVIANSQNAIYSDAGTAIDANNFGNMFSSYYVTGAAMALAIDLELRTRFNKTLDDYMKTLWAKHGKPELAYTMQDLQNALATTTGDAKHAAAFFDAYIYKNKPYDYASQLAKFGIITKQREAGKANIGQNRLAEKQGKLVVNGNTSIGSSIYNAGMDANDELLSIDGEKMTTTAALNTWLSGKKPGDKAALVFLHRNKEVKATLVVGESADIVLQIDANASPEAVALREKWWKSQQ
ncbi:MAG TPA: PDZ domain-containing protein [Phnomibacter sp.]|nr:PDZ domain-containing protein [Phnomibacter sp.]